MAKVTKIFHDVFEDDSIVLSDETNADDIEDWDSLAQINLVSNIEKEFSVKFALGELEDLKKVVYKGDKL